jgi:hypothetical protein
VKQAKQLKANMQVFRAAALTETRISHFFDLPATKRRQPGENGELPRGEPMDGEELGAAWDPKKLDPRLFKAIRIYGHSAIEKGRMLLFAFTPSHLKPYLRGRRRRRLYGLAPKRRRSRSG